MTFILGLTGSIGMGKSTTAQMFRDQGILVWDADETVHRFYEPGQPAAIAISKIFPQVILPDGGVSRPKLRDLILVDASALDRLNSVVHPLVAADRADFLAKALGDMVVLDIPLLYETGAEAQCDAVVVVTAPPDVQRDRVMARGLTEAEFDMILARQMPDADKRARADHVIETLTLEVAQARVKDVIALIRKGATHA